MVDWLVHDYKMEPWAAHLLIGYQGQYDVDGRLMDPEDPFLFWCLPIMRKTPGDPKSPLLCYVFKHAGDDKWERPSLR